MLLPNNHLIYCLIYRELRLISDMSDNRCATPSLFRLCTQRYEDERTHLKDAMQRATAFQTSITGTSDMHLQIKQVASGDRFVEFPGSMSNVAIPDLDLNIFG